MADLSSASIKVSQCLCGWFGYNLDSGDTYCPNCGLDLFWLGVRWREHEGDFVSFLGIVRRAVRDNPDLISDDILLASEIA